jgi:hypothetical protein
MQHARTPARIAHNGGLLSKKILKDFKDFDFKDFDFDFYIIYIIRLSINHIKHGKKHT